MVKRDWTAAREKVGREGKCRVCSSREAVQAAHVMGRKYDLAGFVNPNDIVPLCATHHSAYDGRQLDLLPYLTHVEQAAAVGHVGIMGALRRLSGVRLAPPT